jgi:hypothetical protein
MRRVLVLALLALALPIAAAAGVIDLTNSSGSVSVTNAGVVLGGIHKSQLRSFDGISTGTVMGYVAFSTGSLASGSITGTGGATFNGGGSFIVTGVGAWAKTFTGSSTTPVTLFSGSFVGPVTWTFVSSHGLGSVYRLTGTIEGTLWDGRTVTGVTNQIIFAGNAQFAAGIGHIRMGNTLLAVPEPGTLGLLGTGLAGIAGMFRRKLIGA